MTKAIYVTFTLTEARFMAACHALWAHRAIGTRGNVLISAIVVLCAIILLWMDVFGAWPWVLIGAAVVMLGLDRTRDRLWRRHYRRHPKYTARITAILAPDGVGVMSAEGENRLPWTQFKHYLITSDYLFLLMDQRRFSIIPRDAHDDDLQRQAVDALVQAKLPPLPRRWL